MTHDPYTHAPPSPIGPGWRVAAALLALAAAAISAVLLVHAWRSDAGSPWASLPGCAPGSGCSTVLTSRWSGVLGLPVSLPAMGVYLAVAALLLWPLSPRQPERPRQRARTLLLVLSGTIIAAALWFVVVQWLLIGQWCRWCMMTHTLGLAAAGLIVQALALHRPTARDPGCGCGCGSGPGSDEGTLPVGASPRPSPGARGRAAWLVVLGGLPAAALAAMQIALPPPTHAVVVVPPGTDFDTARLPPGSTVPGLDLDASPPPPRTLGVFGGRVRLSPIHFPLIGPPDAEHLLVSLYDYRCVHCRSVHHLLSRAREHFGRDRLAVVMLPVPLDARCNPTLTQTDPPFVGSCELARLALAVWKLDASQFEAMDRWLFESDRPPELDSAIARALELLGPSIDRSALEATMNSPGVTHHIRRHINAHTASDAGRLPVVAARGAIFVGRPGTAEEFIADLDRALNPPPSPTTPASPQTTSPPTPADRPALREP